MDPVSPWHDWPRGLRRIALVLTTATGATIVWLGVLVVLGRHLGTVEAQTTTASLALCVLAAILALTGRRRAFVWVAVALSFEQLGLAIYYVVEPFVYVTQDLGFQVAIAGSVRHWELLWYLGTGVLALPSLAYLLLFERSRPKVEAPPD